MLYYVLRDIRQKTHAGEEEKNIFIIIYKGFEKSVTTTTLRDLSSSALVNKAFFVLRF